MPDGTQDSKPVPGEITVGELIRDYDQHPEQYYVKNRLVTNQVRMIRLSLRMARAGKERADPPAGGARSRGLSPARRRPGWFREIVGRPPPLLCRRGPGDAAHPDRPRPQTPEDQARRRSSAGLHRPRRHPPWPPDDDLLAQDEALEALAREDPDGAELVRLRAFAGLTLAEAAEVMGIGRRTADSYWAYGRAWLCDALSEGE